jgi:hypothetical protein
MQALIYITIANITSPLSYALAIKYKFCSVEEMFMYSNIWLFFTMLLMSPIFRRKYNINILEVKTYIKNGIAILWLLPTVLAANFKSILANHHTTADIRAYSNLTPFIAILFASILLKEKLPKKNFFIAFTISMIGLAISQGTTSVSCINIWLTSYVLFNALSEIGKKKIANINKSGGGIILENLVYVLVGIVTFILIALGKQDWLLMINFKAEAFSLSRLFSWSVFFIFLVSFVQHGATMIGYRKASSVFQIMFLSLSKVVIGFVVDYMVLGKISPLNAIIGATMMLFVVGWYSLSCKKKT